MVKLNLPAHVRVELDREPDGYAMKVTAWDSDGGPKKSLTKKLALNANGLTFGKQLLDAINLIYSALTSKG